MTANLVQGALFTIMVIRLGDAGDSEFEHALQTQVARSPQFFANAPVVLDLKDSASYGATADFIALKQFLAKLGMIAVGVQNGDPQQLRAATAAGLGHLAATSQNRRAESGTRASNPPAAPAPAPAAANGAVKSLVIAEPVRSGRQIYARGGDLIVLRSVGAGAEIIADGHIHVYGTLRGRAIAGASGDATARIFVDRLEAELISIAGRYLVSDDIGAEHVGHRAQIVLQDQRVVIIRG